MLPELGDFLHLNSLSIQKCTTIFFNETDDVFNAAVFDMNEARCGVLFLLENSALSRPNLAHQNKTAIHQWWRVVLHHVV